MIFYDTCSLLSLQENAFKEKFICSDITLHELENIKTSKYKSEDVRYKARKLTHLLDENHELYETICWTKEMSRNLDDRNDIKIIETALYVRDNIYFDLIFCTNDICCKNIARSYGLQVTSADVSENIYMGYKKISGNTETINIAMENIDYSDWNINEYLIIENYDDGTSKEMRFDGEKFVSLKLPSSKYIKGKNSLQRCALDILNNQDITVAGILGGYGSGKTFISTRMGLYAVNEKGWQSKILMVREPIGEGREVGFLKGDFEQKTDLFFQPFVQQLDGGEFELESLKQRGVIEAAIPYYLKGTTYDNTIIIVDEAEDLDDKQVRLIGTRVGEDSRIIMCGDYKQAVVNDSDSNALVKMCNEFKGNKSFACIYLGEDVRSETSRMFAELFNK